MRNGATTDVAGSASAGSRAALLGATLVDGRSADVFVADGQIVAVGDDAARDAAGEAAVTHDLDGYVLLPAAAEPHAHLDKAMLGSRWPNPSGQIEDALEITGRAFASMNEEDVANRATAALLAAIRNGYTALRTHVNCQLGIGTRGLRTICELRNEFSDLVDIQVVAMAGMPFTGRDGAEHRGLLEEAIETGADLIGGAPELDPNPIEATKLLVAAAATSGLPIDLHLDETTDVRMFTLLKFAKEVARRGLSGRATASHCVSLGQQEVAKVRETARALAEAGVGVITLPQTNLLCQGREMLTCVPRGLTAAGALRAAGVIVAGGGDNWRDPFNPLGRIDPLETAQLLVSAAHFSVEDAYESVSTFARQVMQIPAVEVKVGSAADLLAIKAPDFRSAVAAAPMDRWVFRAGQLIARSRTVQDVLPDERLRVRAG